MSVKNDPQLLSLFLFHHQLQAVPTSLEYTQELSFAMESKYKKKLYSAQKIAFPAFFEKLQNEIGLCVLGKSILLI